MSRTIKFRVWAKSEGDKMWYSDDHWVPYILNLNGDLIYDKHVKESQHILMFARISCDWELMQFTGLIDKNGKEIYEGDIVTSHNGAVMGRVLFQAPSFVIKKTLRAKTWHQFILSPEQRQFQEVIGNIYENPELLK